MSLADLAAEREDRQRQRTAIRYIKAAGIAAGTKCGTALQVFESLYPNSVHREEVRRSIDLQTRAPVQGGSSGTWLKPFSEPTVFLDAFAAQVRQQQVLGRIPGAIKVPLDARTPYPTNTPRAAWVAPGGAIPVGQGTFADMVMTPFMLALIVAATNELLTAIGPDAEATFEALLTNAAVASADRALLDPALAAVPDLSPASITNGAFAVPSSGATVAALQSDLGLLADHMQENGVVLTSPVLIMSPASALRIGGLTIPAPGGQSFAPPVVQSPAAADQVVLLDGTYFAWKDGGLDISASGEAMLEMSDQPTNNANIPTAATGVLASMWDVRAVGFKVRQYLNWTLANPAAVGVVTGFGATP
jgi:hypothetical protein